MNRFGMWEVITEYYNATAANEGWPQVPFLNGTTSTSEFHFNCTVKDFMGSTYGKMPESGSEKQIVMELEYWFLMLTEMLPPELANMTGGVPS